MEQTIYNDNQAESHIVEPRRVLKFKRNNNAGNVCVGTKVRCRGNYNGTHASTAGIVIYAGPYFVTVRNERYNESFLYNQIEEVLG